MPLFVTVNPQQARVGADLAHIVGTDNGNLGVPAGGGGARTQVMYAQAETSFAKNRIKALVDGTSNDIVITGVDSSFRLQGGVFAGTPLENRSIMDVGGGIVAIRIPQDLNAARTGVPAGVTVPVIYDTGACNGAQYCVPGAGGASVADPTDVILFHELAHAFHMVTNVFNVNNVEPPARNDENQLRGELSPPLPARDTASNANPGCGTCGGATTKQCLIVTAAYGSPHAPEVRGLQRMRDTVLRRSVLGEAFFAQLGAEYYRFSPQVAAEMRAAPRLRAQILRVLVEPLIFVLEVTARYVAGGWREPMFVAEVAAHLGVPAGYPQPSVASPTAVHSGLARLAKQLEEAKTAPMPSCAYARARAGELEPVLAYLACVMNAGRSPSQTVRWALLTPVILYWAACAACHAGTRPTEAAAAELLRGIDGWLGSVPIPKVLEYESAGAVRSDLAMLAKTIFATPGSRRAVGPRLLAVLSGRVQGDLRAALRDADYLPPVAAPEAS